MFFSLAVSGNRPSYTTDIQFPCMARRRWRRGARLIGIGGLALVLGSCSHFLSSATEGMAEDLASAIRNQDDPKTVQDGAPAYLLLIDGLIAGDPGNVNLLVTGAKLYGSYATVFVTDAARAGRLADKAWAMSREALCRARPALCGWDRQPFEEFVVALPRATETDVALLYTYASTWAGWIQLHQDDWNAVADVPKVEAIMRRLQKLNEGYDHGGAHLYLGFLSSLFPPSLGGKPDQAREHFERAYVLSHRRNLTARVMLAERYARMIFDRPLHDRLLREVLQDDPHEPGLTLMNVLAQERARALLASADSYF